MYDDKMTCGSMNRLAGGTILGPGDKIRKGLRKAKNNLKSQKVNCE
jgi:hypothetical protein